MVFLAGFELILQKFPEIGFSLESKCLMYKAV